MGTDYEFYLKANFSNYIGKWVAIVDNKVVASGISAKKVYEEALKKGKRPLITKVPDKETMIL